MAPWAISMGMRICSAWNSGERDFRNASSSRSPTRTENSFFSGCQYGGIDFSSVIRFDGPTMLMAQAKASGVNAAPARAA